MKSWGRAQKSADKLMETQGREERNVMHRTTGDSLNSTSKTSKRTKE